MLYSLSRRSGIVLALFSAFSQEYREYARGKGVKFTYTLFKKLILVVVTHREIAKFSRVFGG